MIIPSIDVQNGRAVQLRRGEHHVLTAANTPAELARQFNRCAPVAVVDLDAACGDGNNDETIADLCRIADVRVGGGIRQVEHGRRLLRAGARQLVIGTAATEDFLFQFRPDQIIVALDHRRGVVVDRGWTHSTGEAIFDRALRLAPYCSGYLCTFVEDEGTMAGMAGDEIVALAQALPHRLTVAGGVADTAEAVAISRCGVDVQVGMSLYTGKLDLVGGTVDCLYWEKMDLLPTVVQAEDGQVLMLAYSSRESLSCALREGRGVYYSRSRHKLWRKGEQSGNFQELLSCRSDCDADALLFIVRQRGSACHTGQRSCFAPQRFTLDTLFSVLEQRMATAPDQSYTARLQANPELLDAKVIEEAHEVVEAKGRDSLRWECADLLYHLSVLALSRGVNLRDILAELNARHHDRKDVSS